MTVACAAAIFWLFVIYGAVDDALAQKRERKKWERWSGEKKGPVHWSLTPEGKAGIAEGERQIAEMMKRKAPTTD